MCHCFHTTTTPPPCSHLACRCWLCCVPCKLALLCVFDDKLALLCALDECTADATDDGDARPVRARPPQDFASTPALWASAQAPLGCALSERVTSGAAGACCQECFKEIQVEPQEEGMQAPLLLPGPLFNNLLRLRIAFCLTLGERTQGHIFGTGVRAAGLGACLAVP